MSKKLKIFLISLGSVLLIAIIGVLVFLYPFIRTYIEISSIPTEFNSEIWKESNPEFSWKSVRLKMVDDLLDKYKLVGRDRDNVISLIGESTNTAYFHEYDLVYWLGMERSHFVVDSEWLIIKLDDSGKVIEARTATD